VRTEIVSPSPSSRLEKKDGDLTQVEVDEVLGLVGDVAAEVAPDDAMPRRVVLFVELFLDVRRDVLLDVVLLQRLRRAIDGVLLHVLRHVGILDDCFPIRHGVVFRLLRDENLGPKNWLSSSAN